MKPVSRVDRGLPAVCSTGRHSLMQIPGSQPGIFWGGAQESACFNRLSRQGSVTNGAAMGISRLLLRALCGEGTKTQLKGDLKNIGRGLQGRQPLPGCCRICP